MAGSEPTLAVNLAVNGGLFSARLGDVLLPNMQVLPPGLFRQPDLHLRIWFNDGVNGFAVLEPSQPLTAAPYALKATEATTVPTGAITSAMLANGAVTVSKIAAGSVGGTHLQNGSIQGGHIQTSTITAAHLAPGAVGPGASNQRYLSGRLSVESFAPSIYFGEYQINQAINFSTPFATPPVVTVGLETSLSSAATLLFPILVKNKTTAGFQLSFPFRSLPIGIERRSTIDQSPLAVVNGRPAVAFRNPGLRFARAQDVFGKRWQTPVTVDGSTLLRETNCWS